MTRPFDSPDAETVSKGDSVPLADQKEARREKSCLNDGPTTGLHPKIKQIPNGRVWPAPPVARSALSQGCNKGIASAKKKDAKKKDAKKRHQRSIYTTSAVGLGALTISGLSACESTYPLRQRLSIAETQNRSAH